MSNPATTSPSGAARERHRGEQCDDGHGPRQALRLAEPGGAAHQTAEEEDERGRRAQRALLRPVEVVGRMRDNELVADRDKNDPGDKREVQIGVDVSADLTPLLGGGRADPLQDRAGRPGRSTATRAPWRTAELAGARRRRRRSTLSPEAVAPASTTDSPSTMITKSWKRSPKWAPSICPLAHGRTAHAWEPVGDQRRREVKPKSTQPQNPPQTPSASTMPPATHSGAEIRLHARI